MRPPLWMGREAATQVQRLRRWEAKGRTPTWALRAEWRQLPWNSAPWREVPLCPLKTAVSHQPASRGGMTQDTLRQSIALAAGQGTRTRREWGGVGRGGGTAATEIQAGQR